MILQYLGTAAAEGTPALFCDCEICRVSRARGGRHVRTRSQSIIDGKLLIDFPCDTLAHLNRENLDLCRIRSCLITHVHQDHFYPHDMTYARNGFSHPPKGYSFTVYGSEDILPEMAQVTRETEGVVRAREVRPFAPFRAEEYLVTALPANHGTQHPYVYLISDGRKTILYAHDTGELPRETLGYLAESGVKLDYVSLDCTEGAEDEVPYGTHMCLGSNVRCREELKKLGAANEKTVFTLNHFSHNGLRSAYDEFTAEAGALGFLVSFDGMRVEI